MTRFTRATLTLGLGLGALAACTDGNKAGEDASDRTGTTAGPGTAGSTAGAGPAAGTAGGAAAAAPADTSAAARDSVARGDSARRDSATPPPR